MAQYTPSDVARMLDWPRSRIYDYIREGLVQPQSRGRNYVFEFQDLVVLRAARELIKAQIPSRRVKRALSQLRTRLKGRPLSAVRLDLAGSQVVVREGQWLWEPESGQGQFDFSGTKPPADDDTRLLIDPGTSGSGNESTDFYNQAVDLEEKDLNSAVSAYQRAIELDDRHADAHINLGRILQQQGRLEEAKSHYLQALSFDPGNPVARFNLGTVLEDLGETEAAVEAYAKATSQLADAHLNLARLYASQGDQQRALRHLREVRFWSGHREGDPEDTPDEHSSPGDSPGPGE